jgi:hypothetical protein
VASFAVSRQMSTVDSVDALCTACKLQHEPHRDVSVKLRIALKNFRMMWMQRVTVDHWRPASDKAIAGCWSEEPSSAPRAVLWLPVALVRVHSYAAKHDLIAKHFEGGAA